MNVILKHTCKTLSRESYLKFQAQSILQLSWALPPLGPFIFHLCAPPQKKKKKFGDKKRKWIVRFYPKSYWNWMFFFIKHGQDEVFRCIMWMINRLFFFFKDQTPKQTLHQCLKTFIYTLTTGYDSGEKKNCSPESMSIKTNKNM